MCICAFPLEIVPLNDTISQASSDSMMLFPSLTRRRKDETLPIPITKTAEVIRCDSHNSTSDGLISWLGNNRWTICFICLLKRVNRTTGCAVYTRLRDLY